ncbi:glycosyltransferase [Exiguobacterium sp. s6]|uniref:glycosyltransferase n=1 Tax=Exiguobacterium sp. s6 TaxID=2751236 RepID=UPI001BE916AE|nr:glycosyltransferase [Exiguobacterium sp. s6]
MRNIVFVVNEYNGMGGVQRVISTLSSKFKQEGHRVEVVSINEFEDNQVVYFDKNIPIFLLHDDGYRAPLQQSIFSLIKKRSPKKILKELRRRAKKISASKRLGEYFDKFGEEEVIVIVAQVWGMQWFDDIKFRKNIKLIGQSHESYLASKGTHRYKKVMKYYKTIDCFLTLSHEDTSYFKSKGFRNVDYVYNPSPFREKMNPLQLWNNKRFVTTGRLIKEKGFDTVINAFHLIVHEVDWNLVIIGDGPEREKLNHQIKSLGLSERVFLEGYSSDIESNLKQSSVVVLGSQAEGLPMSLIEGKSLGLPCISTDCAPGIREIIFDYKDGFIVPINDMYQMARQMKRIATNRELYLQFSETSFENSSRFAEQKIVEEWERIFKELERG